MHREQFHLLVRRRFLPLFVTQSLGALNDNVFKNALVILVTYRIAERAGLNSQIMATLAAGLFILPFFLFSATAGQIADRFEKSRLIALIKACEIAFMAMAAIGFLAENTYFLLGVLFLMGVHSTFFGPLKYSILPAHLAENELLGGNGLIEAGTFLAILVGTIAGGLLILNDGGVILVSAAMVAVALAGFMSSLFIPRAPAAAPDLRIGVNILRETWNIMAYTAERRDVFLSMLGISWFWLVGATFLSQFPTFAKDTLRADEQVVTLFLATFSVGIGVGSLLCNRLLKSEISAKYVPFGALGMAVFSIDLYFASLNGEPAPGTLLGVVSFLSGLTGWRISADLMLIAVCGGLYIVPLYAILQTRTEAAHRSRVIAGNNVLNALFMVIAAAATTAMLVFGFSVPDVFLTIAIADLAVAAYICKLLPDELVKAILAGLFKLAYKVELRGLENYRAAGERVVIVANHVSFLDGLLLGTFLPGRPVFAVDTFLARRWWIWPFMRLMNALPLDPTNPLAIKSLVRAVKEGRKCVIFPEGRITVTGALMKIYEGPGLIADKAQAQILPVRIDGAQYTPFSRLRGKVRLRLFPKITISILPPQTFDVGPEIKGRQRRQTAGTKLYDVMADLIYETCNRRQTLFEALLDARAVHGGRRVVVEDIERKPASYDRLVAGSFVLGRRLAAWTAPGEYVGVLLPNSVGAALVFFALQAFGRVPALLNLSTGADSLLSACAAARIATVLTSRRFIDAAGLETAAAKLGEGRTLVYVDKLGRQLHIGDKLFGLLTRCIARLAFHQTSGARPDGPAVVLFTSGSEGKPKGVVLSHENILANRYQLGARIDFNPSDTVFNALPIFHSFGLTGGMLLPMLSGIKTFLYPSPLHFRIVPELVYDTNATILFGTDTFLTGYARAANPYDFYSVRYVFAGAERVRDETRRNWSEKFGLRILEGYGATETSPVIATNTPMHYKAGTVGRLLPGIRHRIEPVAGIERGGRLFVAGPNVMLGYLRAERPGEIEAPPNRWYDTGDIVEIDDNGFVSIVGRAKRFAKIAGEMVSLSAAEEQAAACWPEHRHAVTSLPDPRKGEQLVLVTDCPAADRAALLAYARQQGIAELLVPRTVLTVDRIPLLATGKVDYVAVNALAAGSVERGAEMSPIGRAASMPI